MAKYCTSIALGVDYAAGITLRPSKNSMEVVAAAFLPHEDPERKAHGGTFKALAKNLKTKGADTLLCLPRQSGMVRTAQLPSTDPGELTQMSRFEAQRHIPFNAERHVVDYHIVARKGVEGSLVLLGAVDGPVVEGIVEGAREAGLAVKGTTLSSLALLNVMVEHRREMTQQHTVALLALNLDVLDLVLVREGKLVYARSTVIDLRSLIESWGGLSPDGSAHPPHFDAGTLATALKLIDCEKLSEPPETPGAPHSPELAALTKSWLGRLVRELRQTWDFARREMKCPPIDRILITGEGAAMGHLDRLLAREMGIQTEVFNPVGELPRARSVVMPFGGLAMTTAYGSALGVLRPETPERKTVHMDLTPPAYYRGIAKRRIVRRLTTSSVLLLAALGCSSAAFIRYSDIQREQFEAYSEINARMGSTVKELRDKDKKLQIITRYLNDPNGALPVLQTLVTAPAVPARVSLEIFDYTRDDKVTIDLTAKSIPDMNEYVADLEDSGHFNDVRPSDPQQQTLFRQFPIYKYTLDCPLKVDASKKGEAK